jgi:hypothetical protein
MHCPRCGGELVTFTLAAADESAVTCEACGFVGIPASHRPELADFDSWEQALAAFDDAEHSPERTCEVGRAAAVSTPTTDEEPEIDPGRLEESVTVATALRDGDDESGESDANDESGESDGTQAT